LTYSIKFCQNSFETFGFHFSFCLSKSANSVHTFATNREYRHFSPAKFSACYFKQAPKDIAVKSANFRLSESKNVVNFVKFRKKSIFFPRPPVFVSSLVFRQKRNLLEPNYAFGLSIFG